MNKRKLIISAAVILALCVVLFVQRQMIASFSQKAPHLEILLTDEAVSDASELLAQYSPQDTAEGLVIYPVGDPSDAFLYAEVSDLLKAGGIGEVVMYDGTQSLRLARQALSLSAFCLELCLAVLCLRALWRGGQSFANLFRQELCLKYPREIVRDNLEKLLIAIIAAVVLVVSFILLVRELVAFTPFMPPNAVPPVHIFDISHYLDVLRAPAVQTDYALLCRSTLFSLYIQSICAAVLSLCLLVLLWHRHPKEGFHAKASV